MSPGDALTLVHASDIHYGPPHVAAYVEGLEHFVQTSSPHAVVLSGDISQRARAKEFRLGRGLMERLQRVAPVLAVPGNHDVTWWRSLLLAAGAGPLLSKYRRHLHPELEPVLSIRGAAIVGVNSSWGIAPFTLTKRPRDLSIIGAVPARGLDRAARQLGAAGPGDVGIAVLHHNLTRGDLSRRFGVPNPEHVIARLARGGARIVLTGHDHQEAVHERTVDGRPILILTAGTLSNRSRGGRPVSFFALRISHESIDVESRVWSGSGFVPGEAWHFAR